jgi:hypothetical protein
MAKEMLQRRGRNDFKNVSTVIASTYATNQVVKFILKGEIVHVAIRKKIVFVEN